MQQVITVAITDGHFVPWEKLHNKHNKEFRPITTIRMVQIRLIKASVVPLSFLHCLCPDHFLTYFFRQRFSVSLCATAKTLFNGFVLKCTIDNLKTQKVCLTSCSFPISISKLQHVKQYSFYWSTFRTITNNHLSKWLESKV